MLPHTIFTIETHAEHDSDDGFGAKPHTVGYFLSHGDAANELESVKFDYPKATIHVYPIGTVLK